MDSLQKIIKGQIEGETNVAHSKRFQMDSSSETKFAPLSFVFKKIKKFQKGGKGKCLVAAAKGKGKARVSEKRNLSSTM